jgi:hypothetical protein
MAPNHAGLHLHLRLTSCRLAAIFFFQAVNPTVHQVVRAVGAQLQVAREHPRITGGVAGGAVVAAGLVWLYIRTHQLTAEEIERRRRERLATMGRITDGFIVDARTLDGEDSVSPEPEVLFYSYRLAGVTYNCAQDVSRLAELVRGFRLDEPVQVRYDPRNPGNSVLVSESWSGLWQREDH